MRPILRRACCDACDWTAVWGPEEMVTQLRQLGHLKREAKPEFQLVWSLLETCLPSLTCPSCGCGSIQLRSLDDDDDESWGMARRCELCQQPIPPERLEIFPDSRRCARCQDQPDQATSVSDFCPRCGGILAIRSSGGSGIRRYQSHCGDCGYRSR